MQHEIWRSGPSVFAKQTISPASAQPCLPSSMTCFRGANTACRAPAMDYPGPDFAGSLPGQTHKHVPSHKPDPYPRPTLRSFVAIRLSCSTSNLHHPVEQHISSVLVLFPSITCPFTGANGLQPGDSGLSRSEFSGSVKPDPRAKPFVPPPSLAAKLLAKQGDGWGSDSGSVKSDASGASGGGTQASRMPASQPQGIQGEREKQL